MAVRPLLGMATALIVCGCVQDGPAPYTGGPRDPDSSTTFTLALTPASLVNCTLADPGMTRPMTMVVQNDTGMLHTAGGIHYGLTRVGPNVYAGGDWIKIRASLAGNPKTLSVGTNDGRCIWAGTAG